MRIQRVSCPLEESIFVNLPVITYQQMDGLYTVLPFGMHKLPFKWRTQLQKVLLYLCHLIQWTYRMKVVPMKESTILLLH